MIIKLLLGLFFISAAFAGCTGSDKKEAADRFIENARTFMAQNKPETAVIEYKNAVQVDPGSSTALFELAEAYIALNQFNTSIRYYNLAVKADPDKILPHLRLAQIYMQMDQILDAQSEVSIALKISPDSVEAYHILSDIKIQERDLDAAIETLNKALSLDDKNIKTYLALARLYIDIRERDKAETFYQKAVSVDSASRDAYMGLASLYAEEGETGKVEQLLKEVVKTPGIKMQKNIDLARFYEHWKKFDLAQEKYQKAVSLSPETVSPLMSLAEFYTRRNQKEKALVTMQNALAKNKSTNWVKTGLSQVYLHFGMVEKAGEIVDEVLSRRSDYVDALFQKGRVLVVQKDFKQAIDIFDKVILLNKIHAQAYYYKALCIEKSGATDRPEQKIFSAAAGMLDNSAEFEKDQIKENLTAAITIDPDLIKARIGLLQIYVLEENAGKAREQMEEVLNRQPPNLKIMSMLADVNILEGNTHEAVKILELIIREKPDYVQAYIKLGLLQRRAGDTAASLKYLKIAYSKDSDQIDLVKIMVNTYVKDKQYKAALDLIDTLSIETSPESKPFLENLKGEIFLYQARKDTAMEYFKKAVELEPEYITPHMHIADFHKQKKEFNKALDSYQKVESLKSDFLPALISMGVIFDIQGYYDKAESYYRKVLAINPEHPDAANNLAFILSENPASLEEAFRLAKSAKQKKPKDANVLDTIGWIYYQKGAFRTALSELEESLNLNPDSALACFHYGMTLHMEKEYEKARKYFKKALDIDKNFKNADIAVKMLH
ncbi:MAG: tetratricopeptide repeat protein [Thermodesulfobacteriota bacterium]